jgi:hypothetical protein
MAGFAAAYEQDRNWDWLDEIVGSIITPAQSRDPGHRHFNGSSDDDLSSNDDFVSTREYDGMSHGGRDSRLTRDSSPAASFFTAFGPSRQSSLPRVWRSNSRRSQRAASSRSRRRAESRQSGSSRTASVVESSVPASKERVHLDGICSEAEESGNQERPQRPTQAFHPSNTPQKALFRSLSSQKARVRWDDEKTLARKDSRLSDISEFSGFETHPAIRPLEKRDVLGEAAGPSDDDDAEYPGPLPLTLIIIGICLSVFIISLDRNIITTVSIRTLLIS